MSKDESTEYTQIPLKNMKSLKKNNSEIAVLPLTRQRSQCHTKSQMAEPIDKKSQMANASDISLRKKDQSQRKMGTRVQSLLKFHSNHGFW